ncbi:hypothetical protein J6590_084078 [Homalodisca vitripennis]|nr:hypothetical protein J6590_084078 [Homalodisca vitripennis]
MHFFLRTSLTHEKASELHQKITFATIVAGESRCKCRAAAAAITDYRCQPAVYLVKQQSLWFDQADSQFTVSDVTNEKSEIFKEPSTQNPYTCLRTKLMKNLSPSEEQRVCQLISEEELENRKPSHHFRFLAGGTVVQDNFLRQLWLQQSKKNLSGASGVAGYLRWIMIGLSQSISKIKDLHIISVIENWIVVGTLLAIKESHQLQQASSAQTMPIDLPLHSNISIFVVQEDRSMLRYEILNKHLEDRMEYSTFQIIIALPDEIMYLILKSYRVADSDY